VPPVATERAIMCTDLAQPSLKGTEITPVTMDVRNALNVQMSSQWRYMSVRSAASFGREHIVPLDRPSSGRLAGGEIRSERSNR
jgi:hypothetical protein